MEASQTSPEQFISFEEMEKMGFDPILPKEQPAELEANETKLGQAGGRQTELPRAPKRLRLPQEVIDPCPPLAQLPRDRFSSRHSGEY